jgi:hypothetical protein
VSAALVAEVAALRSELGEALELLRRIVSAPAKPLSASAVERLHELRHGEARRAYQEGRLTAVERRGRRGLELRIDPTEAVRVFGPRKRGAAA